MNATINLVHLAGLYATHQKLSLNSVSLKAANQGILMRRLKLGHDITVGRAQRITQWFSNNWPAGLPWPPDIPRPPPAPDSPAAEALKRATEPLAARSPSSQREVLNIVNDLLDRAAVLTDNVDAFDFDAVQALHKEAMRIGKTLGPDGTIWHAGALALSLGLKPTTLYSVVSEFQDGGEGRKKPQAGTWGRDALDALIDSGDVRFSRWRQGVAA